MNCWCYLKMQKSKLTFFCVFILQILTFYGLLVLFENTKVKAHLPFIQSPLRWNQRLFIAMKRILLMIKMRKDEPTPTTSPNLGEFLLWIFME
ncbi:hypothetical protein HanIR_Chr03g0106081 [Helianthus annuus]|nr:hypothetical protein HanIR_Chr03g0106081 [Helianthus annuus]